VEVRQALFELGVTPLFMHAETAPECSPLDAGWFSIFKTLVRKLVHRQLKRQGTKWVTMQQLDAIVHQAAAYCNQRHTAAYFEHCGLDGSDADANKVIVPSAPAADTRLPFGEAPAGSAPPKGKSAALSQLDREKERKLRRLPQGGLLDESGLTWIRSGSASADLKTLMNLEATHPELTDEKLLLRALAATTQKPIHVYEQAPEGPQQLVLLRCVCVRCCLPDECLISPVPCQDA
jgi:hypothetical protein